MFSATKVRGLSIAENIIKNLSHLHTVGCGHNMTNMPFSYTTSFQQLVYLMEKFPIPHICRKCQLTPNIQAQTQLLGKQAQLI